jgi:cold shock CspA family protein/ribosome-associated translation inhibitor RaiA
MEKPLQIVVRGMEHSAALESAIREKALKLEEFYPRMIGCHVSVEKPHRHRHQGEAFEVRIDIHLPGKVEVAVNRQHAEDVYVALRDAFDAAKRRLEEHIRVQRGDTKSHPLPQRGHVVRVFPEEGYGFIQTEDGRELYFARENVIEPAFEHLTEGLEVQFLEEMAQEGPQAKRVSAGKHRFT